MARYTRSRMGAMRSRTSGERNAAMDSSTRRACWFTFATWSVTPSMMRVTTWSTSRPEPSQWSSCDPRVSSSWAARSSNARIASSRLDSKLE